MYRLLDKDLEVRIYFIQKKKQIFPSQRVVEYVNLYR